MSNPYRIEGPACISFSGGRTSGYMLKHILDAHGGTLPSDVHVCFMNTGKEMPQSLEFVAECAERWTVQVNWLEYDPEAPNRTREVTFQTASRNGEPYEALIRKRSYLPNAVTRFCTTELKIRRAKFFMLSRGIEHWDSVIGIRADEPRRLRKGAGNNSRERWELIYPLATAGVAKQDVLAWWAEQPFDLRLPDVYGQTPAGNCDLCFLKARGTILRLTRERPELAEWWIAQEQWVAANSRSGDGRFRARFRKDWPTYGEMRELALAAQELPFDPDDPGLPCYCGD